MSTTPLPRSEIQDLIDTLLDDTAVNILPSEMNALFETIQYSLINLAEPSTNLQGVAGEVQFQQVDARGINNKRYMEKFWEPVDELGESSGTEAGTIEALTSLQHNFLEFHDPVSGSTKRLSMRDGHIVVTDMQAVLPDEVNFGGIQIDEALSFNVYAVEAGWSTNSNCYGYDDGGIVSQDAIQGADSWFEHASVKGNGYFNRQMLSLVSESMIEAGNIWTGSGTGGAMFSPVLYNLSGAYVWTMGTDNADTPGNAGAIAVNNPLSSVDQKILWNAGHSRMRVGINTDMKLTLQWYVPETLAATVGASEGWHTVARTTNAVGADEVLRYRHAGFTGSEVLNGLPTRTGIPDGELIFPSAGPTYLAVVNATQGEIDSADEVLGDYIGADAWDGQRHTILRFDDTWDTAIDNKSQQLTHEEAVIALRSPLFTDYASNGDTADVMNTIKPWQRERTKACQTAIEMATGFSLAKLNPDDLDAIFTVYDTHFLPHAQHGFLKLAWIGAKAIRDNANPILDTTFNQNLVLFLEVQLTKFA